MFPSEVGILVQALLLPHFRVVFVDELDFAPVIGLFLLWGHFVKVVSVLQLFVLSKRSKELHLVLKHFLATSDKDFELILIKCAFVSFFLQIASYNFVSHAACGNFCG